MSTIPHAFAHEFYFDADLLLAKSVSPSAKIILDVDCGEGRLAEVLKRTEPSRHIMGICPKGARSEAARSRVDQLIIGDWARDELGELGLLPQSVDCIIATSSLKQSANPLALLEKLRPLLRQDGRLITSWPNMQHWSVINRLLRGDMQTHPHDLLRPESRHFLGLSNVIKLFMDAGYLPQLVERRYLPATKEWLRLIAPTAASLGSSEEWLELDAGTYEYFIDARPIKNLPATTRPARPIGIGVCVNDDEVLRDNFLASPCLTLGNHDLFAINNAPNAADGLNAVIEKAQHELIVLIHQDVYLPAWWIHRLWEQYEKALELTQGRLGVMGVWGVRGVRDTQGLGCVVDRATLLTEPNALPDFVDSLDELALIVPKGTPLRFEPSLGWHLYGTDICLRAKQAELQAVAIDAPCYHNAKRNNQIPQAFRESEAAFRQRWPQSLPIKTVCGLIS